MNQRMRQKAYRIDKDMAFLAFDLFPRIIPARVNAAPPFSAPLTLWLSMIADSDVKPAVNPTKDRPPFRFEAGHHSNQNPASFRH
jgi:hypothetical protein